MTEKNLQKPAAFYQSKVGILDPHEFAKYVHMERYEPTAKLEPFVAHYFIARFKLPADIAFTAADILSQPVVHIVFHEQTSFISGVTSSKRQLFLKGNGVFAGIRFKPGGFYPFWKSGMHELTNKTVPTEKIFDRVDAMFIEDLLKQNDATILERFESLLLAKQPQANPKIAQVERIVDAIEADQTLHATSEVAKKVHLSERTLQALFKTYVGVGVKWVIMRFRLLEAVRQAHSQQKPNWTDIAAELGYSTQSHFVNDFRKIIGVSPRQYLKIISHGS